MKKGNAPYGFTLLEILIVMAILSLLAGILFVAFAPVRERGRQTVCTSNLRQFYTALALYRQDYDGADPAPGVKMQNWQLGLPTAILGATYNSPEELEEKHPVSVFLRKYVKDKRIFLCPSYVPPPDGGKVVSYTLNFAAPDGIGGPDFSDVVARLGSRTPVMTCPWHAPRKPHEDIARWERWPILLLNLDGSVTRKMIGRSDFWPYGD